MMAIDFGDSKCCKEAFMRAVSLSGVPFRRGQKRYAACESLKRTLTLDAY